MAESVTSRVEDSIGSGEAQFDPLEYLKMLLDNWRDVGSQLRRSIITLLVLIAVFELMLRAGDTGWVFLGLEVADLTLPLVAIPVVATLVTFEVLTSVGGTLRYKQVYHAVVHVHFRKLYEADLDMPLAPPQLLFGQTMHASVAEAPKWMVKLMKWGITGMMLVLLALPLLFVLYTLWVLWARIGLDIVLLASTLLSIVAMMVSYSTLIVEIYFE
jgi:hypothetical protein